MLSIICKTKRLVIRNRIIFGKGDHLPGPPVPAPMFLKTSEMNFVVPMNFLMKTFCKYLSNL